MAQRAAPQPAVLTRERKLESELSILWILIVLCQRTVSWVLAPAMFAGLQCIYNGTFDLEAIR